MAMPNDDPLVTHNPVLPPGATDIDDGGPPGHVLYTDENGVRRCTCGNYDNEDDDLTK